MIITRNTPFSSEEIEKLKMDEKIILGSMAMDLKRAALGYYRGSKVMAERFFNEALNRKVEANKIVLPSYINKLLNKVERLKNIEPKEKAENALMYSTLIQNFLQHF